MLYTINVAFCKYAWVLIIQFQPNILHINGKKSIFNISSQQLSNLFTSSHKNEGKHSTNNHFQYSVNSGGRVFYVRLSNEDRSKHCFKSGLILNRAKLCFKSGLILKNDKLFVSNSQYWPTLLLFFQLDRLVNKNQILSTKFEPKFFVVNSN